MPAAHTKAPDIQIAFDVPDGVEMALGYLTTDENGILQGDLVSSGQIDIAANEGIMIKISGTIKMGSSGRDVTLNWAQSTSNANETAVLRGSYLSAVEIE